MRWLLGVLLAVLLAWPAPAGAAESPSADFAGVRDLTRPPEVLAMRGEALEFWARRGVTGCPGGVRVLVADSLFSPLDGADPLGRGADCRVWLRADFLRRSFRRWATRGPERVCALVVHEVGHALGLEHSEDPASVMHVHPAVPYDCLPRARGVVIRVAWPASLRRARALRAVQRRGWFAPSWVRRR